MDVMKFEKQCPSLKVSMEFSNDTTWMEATDNFINFLQACGYVFDPAEIGMYIIEQHSEPSMGFDVLSCDGNCGQCNCK
jgi:hypothetical protein